MKLIATKAFDYGGVHLIPGQEFEASHPHAKALIALQKACECTASDEPALVEGGIIEPVQVEPSTQKRSYNRRDMKAK
jgi:hypothetical protein